MTGQRVLRSMSREGKRLSVLQRVTMGVAVLAFICTGFPLSAWAIPSGLYTLGSHTDGGLRPPVYGMRLDNLGGVAGNWTFDFSNVQMTVENVTDFPGMPEVHIFGTVIGGKDTGAGWDAATVGSFELDFLYDTGTFTENADGGVDDTKISGATSHHLNFGKLEGDVGNQAGAFPGVIFDLRSHAKTTGAGAGTGLALQLGDECGLLCNFHRDFDGISGWGWLDHQISVPGIINTDYFEDHPSDTRCCSDFLFTATPVPEPGTMILFGSGLLGLAAWRRFKKTV